MITKQIAQSLMAIVPNKFPATVALTPDTSATLVNVYNCWFKPLDVRLNQFGGVNLQGNEAVLRVPDRELNPVSNGRIIRPRDQITVGNDVYRVLSASLKTVRTVWECVVRKELN